MNKQPSGSRFRLPPLNRRRGVYAFSALIPALAFGAFALWPGEPAGEAEASAEIVAAAPELRPAMDVAPPTVEAAKGERAALDMATTAALEAAVAAPLSDDDPRWGSARPAPASSSVDRTAANEPLQNQLAARVVRNTDSSPFAAVRGEAAAEGPLEQGSAVDTATTASISPDSLPPVEVAEDEAEVAMLEASVAERQQAVPDAAFVVGEASAELFEATTTAYVNFRTGPSNDAETIEILPGGEAIEASRECPHFCQARHDGRNGYIYKSYIAFPGEERAPEPEPDVAEQAAAESTAPAASTPPAAPAAPAEEKRNTTFFDLLKRD